MTTYLKTTIKFFLTSTLILFIAMIFLIANPQKKGITDAKADIYSFTGIDHKRDFDRAIESLGIRPRAYNFNGNTMYFGTSRIEGSRSARETAIFVQNQMVEKGINTKNYLFDAPGEAKGREEQKQIRNVSAAMMKGELVPIRRDDQVYEMASLVGLPNLDEVKKTLSKKSGNSKSIDEFSKGYRYVEVRQKPGSNVAEILAVWTQDDFDSRKMKNTGDLRQSPADTEIPSCVGCRRVRRVEALDKAEPFNLNKWTTNAGVAQTYRFYERAMTNRGWNVSSKQKLLSKMSESIPELGHLRGKRLSLEKAGKAIEITLIPRANGGTNILSIEQYNDTQSN